MRIRGHGSAVAVALAGVAVVIAMGGTAVAVTATVVNIADPSSPSRVAHVDASGRLTVVAPTVSASVNVSYFVFLGTTVLTSPTTATLAVSRLAGYNSGLNSNYPDTNFQVRLVQLIPASTGGGCSNGLVGAVQSVDRLAVGSQYQDLYDPPLVFRPVGGHPYCLGLLVSSESTSNATTYYSPAFQVTAVVLAGTYTPSAAAAAAAAAPPAAQPPLVRPGAARPAGTAPVE